MGEAYDVQLRQSLDPGSPFDRQLEQRRGDLHHIAFDSSRLEDTFRQLKEDGLGLHGDEFVEDADHPAICGTWILPSYSQGVLIELMHNYEPTAGALTEK